MLELVVLVVTRSNGQRQYLREQVNVDGTEERKLFVTTFHVLAERRVRVQSLAGIGRVEAMNGLHDVNAVRTTG